MGEDKIINSFVICLFIVIAISTFFGERSSTTETITGIPSNPIVKPYYGYKYLPGTKSDSYPHGVTGADFSQVYFSAMAIRHGESAYNPKNAEYRDRFNRLPNYPPLTNRLYALLSNVSYPNALAVHNYGSLLLFSLATAFVMTRVGLQRYIWKTFILYILLYFFTPLGLAHFERGQFDMFVAVSSLMMFSCMFDRKMVLAYGAAAGFFGALKWSSFPFLGTFGMFAMAEARPRERLSFVLVPATILSSILCFLPEIREYMASINRYELSASPFGVTYMSIMPKMLAKSFQMFCASVLVAILIFKTNGLNRDKVYAAVSFPYAMAMSIQGLCFGTISYEYRVVALMALIPALIIWLKNTPNLSNRFKYGVSFFFLSFMAIAFRAWDIGRFIMPESDDVIPLMGADSVIRTNIFHTAGMICLIFCLYIILKTGKDEMSCRR